MATPNETDDARTPDPSTVISAAHAGPLPGPFGVWTAVAIDWGLAVQFLTLGVLSALGMGTSSGAVGRIGGAMGAVVAAAALFVLGEGMRRGVRLAWQVQVVLTGLIVLAGLALLPGVIETTLHAPHLSPFVLLAILLGVAPVLFVLLVQPRTRAWYGHVTPAEARARHGGRWVAEVAIAALLGGLAIGLERFY